MARHSRENVEQWHSFSQLDVAYIYILKACRDFGISIRKLQNAKESFTARVYGDKFSLIEIAYTYFAKKKDSDDIYLFMDESGRCSVVRAVDIILMAQSKMISNHFILNLNEVWNEK